MVIDVKGLHEHMDVTQLKYTRKILRIYLKGIRQDPKK